MVKDVRCVVYGEGCVVCGVWLRMCGVWCMVKDVLNAAPSTRFHSNPLCPESQNSTQCICPCLGLTLFLSVFVSELSLQAFPGS